MIPNKELLILELLALSISPIHLLARVILAYSTDLTSQAGIVGARHELVSRFADACGFSVIVAVADGSDAAGIGINAVI